MSHKNKDNEKIIMRHILEVRLKKHLFSFMDFRGHMIDKLSLELKAEQIKMSSDGGRFDLADKNLKHLYFFSFKNFGLQIEAASSFDEFKSKIGAFIKIMENYKDYRWNDGLVRVGTRSIILYHRKFDNKDSIKTAYKDLLVNNHGRISELTKSEIVDTAHTFDLKLPVGVANVLTGPVTKEEALQKCFDNKDEYVKGFNKDNGLLLSIDIAGNNPEAVTDWAELKTKVDSQIDTIQTVFDGFKTYFEPKE